ncbi:MAG: CHAD domain-containing protein, partial [Flavobacteriales bacterium]
MGQHFHLSKQGHSDTTRSYLDTFDWRVFKKDGVLEVAADNSGRWITWRSLGADQIYGKYPINKIPRFVWDLKVTGFREKLEKILGIRALLPVVHVRSRIHVFSVLNRQEKTVLRVEIQSDGVPYKSRSGQHDKRTAMRDKRVHLFPMKGYERVVKNACEVLQYKCNLVPVDADPFVTSLMAIRCKPWIDLRKPSILDPEQRTDMAAKSIFYHLLKAMKQNEDGMRKDIDSEFLHDFRVAVRRTRSSLDQMKQVLPSYRITRFSREFAWLGQVTGPLRDMDVYLLSFDSFRLLLSLEIRDDLMPLRDFLKRHKIEEHKQLIKALNTERYRKLKRDWEKFLTESPPKNTTLLRAKRPVINVASEKIWRIYRKAIKQGKAIGSDSPATLLHQLRKTCKKLRYLNEFFHDLFPEDKVRELITSLKILQDNLGEFQDLEVQQISLGNFIQA